VPRHYFIKGYQTDRSRHRRQFAVPVSPSELRERQPEPSIIDLYLENEWIDALPRRFHD
jgi:hypothetical protein